MAKIYLIRHGESIANTLGIYQGQTYDTDLSPLGYKQVATLRDYFAGKNITKIYASPLTRTRKTAHQVSLATKTGVVINHELLETNHGEWEGLPKAEIAQKWGNLLARWNHNPQGVAFPGGETYDHLCRRIITWFDRLNKNQDTVVVTHDNVIRVLLAHLQHLENENFWSFPLDPAGITILSVKKGVTKIEVINQNRHLQDCLTNLALHAL